MGFVFYAVHRHHHSDPHGEAASAGAPSRSSTAISSAISAEVQFTVGTIFAGAKASTQLWSSLKDECSE